MINKESLDQLPHLYPCNSMFANSTPNNNNKVLFTNCIIKQKAQNVSSAKRDLRNYGNTIEQYSKHMIIGRNNFEQ